jgi:flagellum-specific peptidoglycan hydrolase FlgJ/LysM repeat protein
MESRKQIRKTLQRQKRSQLLRRGAATTTALVSTVNLLPVGVLADVEQPEAGVQIVEQPESGIQIVEQPQDGVQVVEQAPDSETVETQPETGESSPESSPEVQEDNQSAETSDSSQETPTNDSSSDDASQDTGTTTSTEESVSATPDDSETSSDVPLLSEAERVALETKIMPNVDRVNTRSNVQQRFIQQVGPLAQQVASVNDLYASVMIAQAILESGWGQSTLTTQANNMFGIKGSYNGQFVEMRTLEDDGKGNLYEIVAKFRKYPSLKESFEDNAHVLKTTSFVSGVYFYSGAWKSNTSSYRDATQWLQGRYATDTTYASKLNNLITTYNLTQFDSATGGGSGTGTGNTGNTNNNSSEQTINKQFKTTAALNIRSDASTSASVVGSLANNATFKAVAQKQGTSVNGNRTWYRVEGKGWVSGAYVTETGSTNNSNNSSNNSSEQTINKQFKTTAALNIRSDASTSASIVGSLANNATFKAVAQKQGTSVNGNRTWYRVEGKGWVSGAYVTETSTTNNNNSSNSSEQTINKQYKTTATLNIRSDASTSASIVGSLANNATFKAVAQKQGTSVNGNRTWYRVEGKGWVSGAYVKEVSTTTSNSKTHTVKSGDTLWGISQSYGVSINQLMQWNNISSSLIFVGQRLIVSK